MIRRVLVTRPEPGASRTAARLRALGFEPVVLPLSEIRAIPAELAPLDGFDAVAATSANALRMLPDGFRQRLVGVPLFAVGAATADAAREFGFTRVTSGPGDGSGLARLIADAVPKAERLLYLCGTPRDGDFEAALAGVGIACLACEVYRAAPVDLARVQAALAEAGSVDAVLIYSAEGGRFFATLAATPIGGQLLAQARVLALSEKCASSVAGGEHPEIRVAALPNEDALFDLLGRGT